MQSKLPYSLIPVGRLASVSAPEITVPSQYVQTQSNPPNGLPPNYKVRPFTTTVSYDEFGRLNSSVAGGNGFYATFNPQQDAFGNVTNSSYHYWQNGTSATTFTATYQNNRVTSVTDNGVAQTWNYDAMGNRTGIVKTSDGTTLESIAVNAMGRGVAAGSTLDGVAQVAIFQGNYYIRSTVFGGEIVTTVDSSGIKTSGRVLDGGSLLAEQIKFSDGTTTVRWHHRDPLNLVARDTEPGQVKRRVHAVTPNGAQIETSDGVDLGPYYACLFAPGTPSCTQYYNPQPASTYGYLADQANGMLAAGLKVDGALTLKSLSDIARQIGRTGNGSIAISNSLFGTPMGAAIGVTAGRWQKRQVWTDIDTRDPTQITARDDSYYEWVPGGDGIGADIGLTGWQQGGKPQGQSVEPPSQLRRPYPCITARQILARNDIKKALVKAWQSTQDHPNKEEFGGWIHWDFEKWEINVTNDPLPGITLDRTGVKVWEGEYHRKHLNREKFRDMAFLMDFHTHPTGNDATVDADTGALPRQGVLLGITVKGPKSWSVYSKDNNNLSNNDSLLDKCLPIARKESWER